MTKVTRASLRSKIESIEGLTNEERSALLNLINTKKYGLVWEDKPEEAEERLQDELPVLEEVKERALLSDNSAAPNHILIEGDNLHALTALSYTHAGKIDVIYIDPPYNTGNKDFIYNDKYVDSEDEFRHSKWLSFMKRRLKIAKSLLSNDGVIFISIDDNEQAALRLLCDELFGFEHFVACFPRLTTKSGKTPLTYMISNDYVLCYTKNNQDVFCGTPFEDSSYKYEDEYIEERGKYNLKQPLDCNSISYSPSLDYVIEHEGILYYPGSDEDKYLERKNGNYKSKDYAWRWSRDLYEFGLKNGWIVFKKGRIYTKGYLNVTIEKNKLGSYFIKKKIKERKMSTIDFVDNEFSNDIAKKQLVNLNIHQNFDYPKPLGLVGNLLQTYRNKDAVILDFFAGTGTTLHAVVNLNAKDKGHRQCILSQINENNICEDVTYERNKRVINGYTTPKGEQVEGLHDNNLRYYKTNFVGRKHTNRNMRKLMEASTDMLCIKNDVYKEQDKFGGRKLNKNIVRFFDDGKTPMLIIYNELAVEKIVDVLMTMQVDRRIKIYVFSNSRYAYDDDFMEVADKVELCALPDAIYRAYVEVIGKQRPKQIIEDATANDETSKGRA